MVVSYKRLWHLLIDKNMNKTDLKRATGISSSTLANMVAGKNVSMDVLLKICDTMLIPMLLPKRNAASNIVRSQPAGAKPTVTKHGSIFSSRPCRSKKAQLSAI